MSMMVYGNGETAMTVGLTKHQGRSMLFLGFAPYEGVSKLNMTFDKVTEGDQVDILLEHMRKHGAVILLNDPSAAANMIRTMAKVVTHAMGNADWMEADWEPEGEMVH